MSHGWLSLAFPFIAAAALGVVLVLLAIVVRTSEGWTELQSNLAALGVVLLLFGSAGVAFLRLRA
ncbi:MAG: hypothetical protein MUC90_07805 [Thermoplasmata archaeon]|nr:hypothetical protein [Thermoplasmata archaeon]